MSRHVVTYASTTQLSHKFHVLTKLIQEFHVLRELKSNFIHNCTCHSYELTANSLGNSQVYICPYLSQLLKGPGYIVSLVVFQIYIYIVGDPSRPTKKWHSDAGCKSLRPHWFVPGADSAFCRLVFRRPNMTYLASRQEFIYKDLRPERIILYYFWNSASVPGIYVPDAKCVFQLAEGAR